MFYGKGGYDFEVVYNMPIWLRKFTFKQISDYYEEVNKPESSGDSSTEIDFNNPLAAAQSYRQNVRR